MPLDLALLAGRLRDFSDQLALDRRGPSDDTCEVAQAIRASLTNQFSKIDSPRVRHAVRQVDNALAPFIPGWGKLLHIRIRSKKFVEHAGENSGFYTSTEDFIKATFSEPQYFRAAADRIHTAPAENFGSDRFPIVRLQPAEVEWAGKVHQVSPDLALAFYEMVENHPDRVGLTKLIGPHPERKLAKLPADLKAIVDTNGKGSRLKLS
jgi:hypothetical protein